MNDKSKKKTYVNRVINTSVDDIGADTLTGGAVIVAVGVGALLSVGDTAETPWGTLLADDAGSVDLGVLLNVLNLIGVSDCV